jgi:hypothetical protein
LHPSSFLFVSEIEQTQKNNIFYSPSLSEISSPFHIMSFSPLFILSILLALSFFASFAFALPECGFAFDGATPLVDLDRQSDKTHLRAHWYGFFGVVDEGSTGSTGTTGSTSGYPLPIEPPSSTSGVVTTGTTGTTGQSGPFRYQVAVISEKLVTDAILSSGPDADPEDRCRNNPGFKGKADVMNFETVPTALARAPEGFLVDVWKSGNLNLTSGVRYYVVLKVTGFGRSIYTNTDGIVVGVGGSGSDDDDEFPPYKAGLIAMGIAICCLLVLLLLLILVAKGKGEDKYTTTVHRNENVDKL